MFILNWNGTQGTAAAGGQPWALRIKPDLNIDFDTLSYSLGAGSKTLHTQTLTLTSGEILCIEEWLTTQNPYQSTEEFVHGVDIDGQYLGLVPKNDAAFVSPGPPPSGEGWRWQADKRTWANRLMTFGA
jgi:hypothetical protein